jgi:hypothetical protein
MSDTGAGLQLARPSARPAGTRTTPPTPPNALGGPLAANALQLAITKMRQQYRGTGRNKVPLNIKPAVPDRPARAAVHGGDPAEQRRADQGLVRRRHVQPAQGVCCSRSSRPAWAPSASPTPTRARRTPARRQLLAGQPPGPARPSVAYRRGTEPLARSSASFTLDKGQWGIGWDVNLDIGASSSTSAGSSAPRARRNPAGEPPQSRGDPRPRGTFSPRVPPRPTLERHGRTPVIARMNNYTNKMGPREAGRRRRPRRGAVLQDYDGKAGVVAG